MKCCCTEYIHIYQACKSLAYNYPNLNFICTTVLSSEEKLSWQVYPSSLNAVNFIFQPLPICTGSVLCKFNSKSFQVLQLAAVIRVKVIIPGTGLSSLDYHISIVVCQRKMSCRVHIYVWIIMYLTILLVRYEISKQL